jgi:hypothetical protein
MTFFTKSLSRAAGTLVAPSTPYVSVRSKQSNHVLLRSLVSMTSVFRKSWHDLGAVVALTKPMVVRNEFNTMRRLARQQEGSLCGL